MKIKCPLLRKDGILSAIFFLIVLISCKDEGALVPEFNSALLNLNDTAISVTSVTIIADSIRTDRVSRSLCGKLNDRSFGLTSSEFYTQIYMPSEALNTTSINPDNIDSVVLQLAYDQSYGYPASQQLFVYELLEDLNDSSSAEYYSTSGASINGTPLGYATISANPTDTIRDSAPEVVRIKLDVELGRRFAGKEFNSQSEWLDFFKGIKVSPGPTNPSQGEGAIVYFNLLNSKTKLHVYYNKVDSSEGRFSFIVESAAQRFSHFAHDYTGSDLFTSLGNTGDQVNYLSSLAGSNIKLTFDGLEKLSADLGPIAINKAELIVPFEDPVITEYNPPSKAVILYKNDADDWVLPIDWYKNGSSYFGGTIDLVKKEYRFNLASTLHELINLGEYNRELVLTISGSSVTANRLVMNSGVKNPVTNKREIYLHLTYTKQR